jgi:hypothetical protein
MSTVHCSDAISKLNQIHRKVIKGVELLADSTAIKLEAEAKSPKGVNFRPLRNGEDASEIQMSRISEAEAKAFAQEHIDDNYNQIYKHRDQTAQTRQTTKGSWGWEDNGSDKMLIDVGSDSPQAAVPCRPSG